MNGAVKGQEGFTHAARYPRGGFQTAGRVHGRTATAGAVRAVRRAIPALVVGGWDADHLRLAHAEHGCAEVLTQWRLFGSADSGDEAATH